MWQRYLDVGYRWGYYADSGGLWVDNPQGETIGIMPVADIKPYWMRLRFIYETVEEHQRSAEVVC